MDFKSKSNGTNYYKMLKWKFKEKIFMRKYQNFKINNKFLQTFQNKNQIQIILKFFKKYKKYIENLKRNLFMKK